MHHYRTVVTVWHGAMFIVFNPGSTKVPFTVRSYGILLYYKCAMNRCSTDRQMLEDIGRADECQLIHDISFLVVEELRRHKNQSLIKFSPYSSVVSVKRLSTTHFLECKNCWCHFCFHVLSTLRTHFCLDMNAILLR